MNTSSHTAALLHWRVPLFFSLFCLMTFVIKISHRYGSLIMLLRFLSHQILNVRNDLYSLQHSLFMMVFNVPMNLLLLQWWYCWKMNSETERQKLILNDVLTWLQTRYWWDWTLNAPKYEPSNCWLWHYRPGLIVHCLNQHCTYCSWQHWLCLHAWRYLLMWLFWFCVDSWKCRNSQRRG